MGTWLAPIAVTMFLTRLWALVGFPVAAIITFLQQGMASIYVKFCCQLVVIYISLNNELSSIIEGNIAGQFIIEGRNIYSHDENLHISRNYQAIQGPRCFGRL
jgi:hypothetical protein